MAKKMESLEQLLVEELQDLFDAEKQLVRALPKMAKSATDEELENAFRQHLEVTRGHVQRLEQVFESLDMRARSKPCAGMKGLVAEGEEMIEDHREETVLDAGLIGAARRVEHYEMAGYESARVLARQLGMRDAAQLLQETLREEMQADKELAQISTRLLRASGSQRKAAQQEEGRGRATGSSRRASPRGSSASHRSRRDAGSGNRALTDPAEIRRWAEERGATPACVKGTGNRGDIGMLRLDFPGYTGAGTLQPISWEAWSDKFEERRLALLVQDRSARGERSNFNKLVNRNTLNQKTKPKVQAAR